MIRASKETEAKNSNNKGFRKRNMEKIKEGKNTMRSSKIGSSKSIARTSSSSFSALTVEDFKEFANRASHYSTGTSLPWTDEKHNCYIESLESSFVEQLQHSMHTCNASSKKDSTFKVRSPFPVQDRRNTIFLEASDQNFENEEQFAGNSIGCSGSKRLKSFE